MTFLRILAVVSLVAPALGQRLNTLEVRRLTSAAEHTPFPAPWDAGTNLSDYQMLVAELGFDPRLDFPRLTSGNLLNAKRALRERLGESAYQQRIAPIVTVMEQDWLARKQDVLNFFSDIDGLHDHIRMNILQEIDSIYARLGLDPKIIEGFDFSLSEYLLELGQSALSLASNLPGAAALGAANDLISYAMVTVNGIKAAGDELAFRPREDPPFPLQIARVKDAINDRFKEMYQKNEELRSACLRDWGLLQSFSTFALTPSERASILQTFGDEFDRILWGKFLPLRVEGGQPELVEVFYSGSAAPDVNALRARAQTRMAELFFTDPETLSGGFLHIKAHSNGGKGGIGAGTRHRVGLVRYPLVLKNLNTDGTRKADLVDSETAERIYRTGMTRTQLATHLKWIVGAQAAARDVLKDDFHAPYEILESQLLQEDFRTEFLEYTNEGGFVSAYKTAYPPSLVRYGNSLVMCCSDALQSREDGSTTDGFGGVRLKVSRSTNGRNWSTLDIVDDRRKTGNTRMNTPGGMFWLHEGLVVMFGTYNFWLNGAFTFFDTKEGERQFLQQGIDWWDDLVKKDQTDHSLFETMEKQQPGWVEENRKLRDQRAVWVSKDEHGNYRWNNWGSTRWWSLNPYYHPGGGRLGNVTKREVIEGGESKYMLWQPDDDRSVLWYHEPVKGSPSIATHRDVWHIVWQDRDTGEILHGQGSERIWSGRFYRTRSGAMAPVWPDLGLPEAQELQNMSLGKSRTGASVAEYGRDFMMAAMTTDATPGSPATVRLVRFPAFMDSMAAVAKVDKNNPEEVAKWGAGGLGDGQNTPWPVVDPTQYHASTLSELNGTPKGRPGLVYDWERGMLYLAVSTTDGKVHVFSRSPGENQWVQRWSKDLEVGDLSLAVFHDALYAATETKDQRVFVGPLLELTEPRIVFVPEDDPRYWQRETNDPSQRVSKYWPPAHTAWEQPTRAGAAFHESGFDPSDSWAWTCAHVDATGQRTETRIGRGPSAIWNWGLPDVGPKRAYNHGNAWYLTVPSASEDVHVSLLSPPFGLHIEAHEEHHETALVSFHHNVRMTQQAQSACRVFVCSEDGERIGGTTAEPDWMITSPVDGFQKVQFALPRALLDTTIRLEFEYQSPADSVTERWWIIDDIQAVMP